MKIDRLKNASRNMKFGVLLRAYQILLPFAMRTIMMYEIGVQYLGLNSLFTSILQVLNLAELGVGTAMVFSMYKPIAEDDTFTVCALMRLYKIYYRIIGAVILVAGLFLLPFIPDLIKDEVPYNINIYYLYLLNLLATALSYWLFAYRSSILQAYQRLDVCNKIQIVTDTIKYTLQIVTLAVFHNYYYYVIVMLLTQILNNIFNAIVSKKMFPQYNPQGKLPTEKVKAINQKVKDFFTARLGGTIVNSADTIVISAFLGITVLAKYQNYYYILSSVMGFVGIIYSSITAGVGNSMLVKTVDQNYDDFKVLTFLVAWVCTFCVTCFSVLYQPFMKLWMGEEMLLDNKMVILFCLYFWIHEFLMMISVYKDAGGIWHEDRYRPLLSGLANLFLNLLLVKFVGLYGILLSTILSMCLVSVPWIIKNVFILIFKRSPWRYLQLLVKYTLKMCVIAGITYSITSFIPDCGINVLIMKGIMCAIMSNVLFLIFFVRDDSFSEGRRLLYRILKVDAVINKFLKKE